MQQTNRNSTSVDSFKKQTGATLFTSLIFLTLMTIVTVSAAKISMVDILVAGNDQQQMVIFHETENDLAEFTATARLSVPLARARDGLAFGNGGGTVNGVVTDNNTFSFAGAPADVVEVITDLEEKYGCLRNGVGSSIGPSGPQCKLYDFQIRKSSANNTGVRDKHHHGAGKMVPNSSSNGSML